MSTSLAVEVQRGERKPGWYSAEMSKALSTQLKVQSKSDLIIMNFYHILPNDIDHIVLNEI